MIGQNTGRLAFCYFLSRCWLPLLHRCAESQTDYDVILTSSQLNLRSHCGRNAQVLASTCEYACVTAVDGRSAPSTAVDRNRMCANAGDGLTARNVHRPTVNVLRTSSTMFEHLAVLDFGDRPPRSHTFDRGRPPATARYGLRRPLRARTCEYSHVFKYARITYGCSENAT